MSTKLQTVIVAMNAILITALIMLSMYTVRKIDEKHNLITVAQETEKKLNACTEEKDMYHETLGRCIVAFEKIGGELLELKRRLGTI